MNRIIFKSQHNLFKLLLPESWEHDYSNNVYSFYCKDELQGVLQISAFYSNNVSEFDSCHELSKEKAKYPTAEIIRLSTLKAVHYALENQEEKLLYYYWITGEAQTKVFCTLIVNAQQESFKLDKTYQTVLKILETIKISSPS